MSPVYFPVFLMLFVAVAMAVGLWTLTTFAGPKAPSLEKSIPYESGSETTGARHLRLSVKFYLTAILFVAFDVEVVFLYPWASLFRELGWFGFAAMLPFLIVLVVAFVYDWKKGALEWQS
jgi:NADH-quinone oxidoreductase subunit A